MAALHSSIPTAPCYFDVVSKLDEQALHCLIQTTASCLNMTGPSIDPCSSTLVTSLGVEYDIYPLLSEPNHLNHFFTFC